MHHSLVIASSYYWGYVYKGIVDIISRNCHINFLFIFLYNSYPPRYTFLQLCQPSDTCALWLPYTCIMFVITFSMHSSQVFATSFPVPTHIIPKPFFHFLTVFQTNWPPLSALSFLLLLSSKSSFPLYESVHTFGGAILTVFVQSLKLNAHGYALEMSCISVEF